MNEQNDTTPARRALRTFLAFVLIFLLYAIAVQVTDINLQKLRDENRQTQVTGVLRFLADPDFSEPDAVDLVFGEATGPVTITDTFRDTTRLILETIFMALVATTIGTLLAIPVSFTAARNLMVTITAPLAAIMSALIALPIGGGVGLLLTRALLAPAGLLIDQVLVSLTALVGITAVLWFLTRRGPATVAIEERSLGTTVVAIGRTVLILILTLVGVGLLATVGRVAGVWLEINLGFFGFLGNFMVVIADLIRLTLAPLMALLGGIIAMSLGARYGQELVLRLEGIPARLLTGVLTALGTAVLIFGIGSGLNWLYQFDNPANWTTFPALIGGGAAGLLSLFLAPKRPFAIGAFIYGISRSILNVLRSIEPLIMAVVFVVWVGLGPFAGVMALTLHTIAALGKLFSEQIEGISEGPIEAINATGANRLQMVAYAVIPQIVPPYIAYTLYRWDINVRMSTIIGFVGGGGVGFLLSQSIRLLRYRDASVMMLAIAIVVSALDYISAQVRARII